MQFEWDEEKRRSNIRKHGIDFAAAVEIFESVVWETLDTRTAYDEDRWRAVGWMRGRLIQIVYTERSGVVRIISARKVRAYEAEEYFRNAENIRL